MPSKAQLKRWGVIFAVGAIGSVVFNTLANRVPAVNTARTLIRNGV